MIDSPHHSHWATHLLAARLGHWPRLVGTTLALRFRNKETGLMCPSVPTLAKTAGCSISTVKRAVIALEAAGWLERTDGRGTGKFTEYRLRWPDNVAVLDAQKKKRHTATKKVSDEPLTATPRAGKRSVVSHQEVNRGPFYKNQKINQKADAKGSGEQHSYPCPVTSLTVIAHEDVDQIEKWDRLLAQWDLPPIRILAQRGSEKGRVGWYWPYRFATTDPERLALVKRYAHWLHEMQSGQPHQDRRRRHEK
ncbi:helix-turn-helix domain-containing protein [Aliiroseovarius sp. CAU 1755]